MTIPPEDYPESFPYYSIFADCIAYWDFKDGSLYDVVDNKAMTLINSPSLTTDYYGYSNNGYHFDGTDDIMISSNDVQNSVTTEFSFILVAKLNTLRANQYILNNRRSAGFGNWWALEVANSNIMRFIIANAESQYDGVSYTIDDTNYHIFVGTFKNGDSISIYEDGVLKQSITPLHLYTPYTYRLIQIGAFYSESIYAYYAQIDISACMFFNKKLTTTEITQLTSLLQNRYIYPTQKVAMQE